MAFMSIYTFFLHPEGVKPPLALPHVRSTQRTSKNSPRRGLSRC